MLAFMVTLSTDNTVQAAAHAGVKEVAEVVTLAERIAGAWEGQLEEEWKQRVASMSANHPGRHKAPSTESGRARIERDWRRPSYVHSWPRGDGYVDGVASRLSGWIGARTGTRSRARALGDVAGWERGQWGGGRGVRTMRAELAAKPALVQAARSIAEAFGGA